MCYVLTLLLTVPLCLAHAGPIYCTRPDLVKNCFEILDSDHHDWMSFAFLASHAVYRTTCARCDIVQLPSDSLHDTRLFPCKCNVNVNVDLYSA